MSHHVFLLLLLHSNPVFSIYQGMSKSRGDYGIIHGEMEYYPFGEEGYLGDRNGIHSIHQCAQHCMFNELCRTATYYEDSKSCRLFSLGKLQGNMRSRAQTQVIDFVDRSKERKSMSMR